MRYSRLLFLCIFLAPLSCSAAEKIVVTPAFQEFTLSSDQVNPGEVGIQNQTGSDQQFQVRAVGFHSLDLSAGVAFLGSDINNENLFSADFVTFENENFPVPAGETRTFSFEIRDQASLAPGGHYAALIFQSLPVVEENNSQKIAVRQIFSALLFIEKTGGATKELQLMEFSEQSFLWMIPKDFSLRFTNGGNTHVTPRGTLRLENSFGNIQPCGVINESSGLLLPNQDRVFLTNLKCRAYLPGLYTWHVSYRYDGKEDFVEVKNTFWLLPYPFLLLISAGLVLLLVLRKKKLFLWRKKV